MATQDKTITRIYSISVPGAEKANQQVRLLNEAFEELKGTKMTLNKEMAVAITSGADVTVLQNLKNKITELEKSMRDLGKQRVNAEKEALAQARAEKELALAKAAEAKAAENQARAEATRTNSLIAQEKELDRQIALEEKQAAALAKQKRAVDPLVGSYAALYKEYRELYNLMKATPEGSAVDFRGQLLQYDEAIAKLKSLAAAEQDFRRQFSRDGLLVGEYTSGIIQAFKDNDLGDLIKNQISKGEAELKKLNNEFKETKQKLSEVGVTGQGSLEVLERQLIENRQAAAQLKTELGKVRNDFNSMGSAGNQMTESLRRGFQSLKRDLASFVLGYVGFQAALNVGRQSFQTVVALDSQAEAMKNVSITAQELAKNNEFLQQTTEQLGLDVLSSTSAFKNFYAASTQAGISADETRKIFFAASAASANLKLSQEDTNGVLLAFSQIASKGKVQAEELRGQIGERVPGAFSIAAKAMGVTQQELNKMLETGQVVSSEFLPKFAAELQRTFGGDTTKNVEGLQASIARFKNQFTEMIADNQKGITTMLNLGLKFGSVLLGVFGIITGNLPLIITLVSAWATGWAILNKEIVIANTRLALLNARIIIYQTLLGAANVLTAAATVAQTAYSAALGLFTGTMQRATAATTLFGTALRLLPFGIILTILALVVTAFKAFGSAVTGSSEALRKQAIQAKANADLMKAINDATVDTISKIQQLAKVVTDSNVSLKQRKDALQDLININPEYLQGLTLENIKTREGVGIIWEYVKALKAKAEMEAIGAGRSKALQQQMENEALAQRALTDPKFAREEYRRLNPNSSFSSSVADAFKYGSVNAEGQSVAEYYRNRAKDDQSAIDYYDTRFTSALAASAQKLTASQQKHTATTVSARRAQLEGLIKQSEKDYDALIATDRAGQSANLEQRKKYQDELSRLMGEEEKTRSGRGSRLTGAQKDAFKDIDAIRDEQLRNEKIRFQDLQKERATDEQDEIEHLQRIQAINNDATAAKLARLNSSNAAERKVYQELQDARVNSEIETNQKVYELRDAAAKRELDRAKKAAEAQLNAVLDSDASPARRAQAQVEYQQALLKANNEYYASVIAAAADNKKRVAELEQQKADALLEVNRNLNKSLKQLRQERYNEEVDNIRRIARLQQDILNTQNQQRLLNILRDPRLTTSQKQRGVDRLNQENDIDDLSIQIDATDKEIALMKRKYGMFAMFNQEYTDLVRYNAELLTRRQQMLNDQETASTKRAWRAKEESLMSYIQQRLDLDAGEMEIIRAGGRMAEQLLQGYFELESQRLEQKREASLKRLEIEKEERVANAQSLSEKEAIEKEFAQRTKDAERKAAKEKQQLSLKQIAIDSAVAAIKAFATAPNYIVGAIQAAAIGVAYLFNRAKIQQQQFQFGGLLRRKFARGGDVPTRGGEFGGNLHTHGGTPFAFQGSGYEAEVGELAIINRKSAVSKKMMTVTGTARQIASAINEEGGGVRFAHGAKVLKYAQGGYLGSRLQAPVFVPASTYAGRSDNPENEAAMAAIVALGNAVVATADRIDRLEVVQVTSTVTNAQAKEAKATSIGTL